MKRRETKNFIKINSGNKEKHIIQVTFYFIPINEIVLNVIN